jgi:hypothetical protein
VKHLANQGYIGSAVIPYKAFVSLYGIQLKAGHPFSTLLGVPDDFKDYAIEFMAFGFQNRALVYPTIGPKSRKHFEEDIV